MTPFMPGSGSGIPDIPGLGVDPYANNPYINMGLPGKKPSTGGGGGSSSSGGGGGVTGVKWIDTLIALGIPIATILTGLLTGSLSAKTIEPLLNPGMFPDIKEPYGRWLESFIGKGVETYPGEIAPDISQTMLPQVWGAWGQQDQGTQFLADFLGQPRQDQALMDIFKQAQMYGGPEGRATDLMSSMTQFGGTGGVGNNMMSLLAQYGAPSQAGQYVANMAQYGIASPGSGGALAARAAGQPTAASQWLAPFLTLNPSYTAPTPGGK